MPNSVFLRPFEAADLDDVLAVYHAARPLGVGPPGAKSDFTFRYVAADDADGQIIGYGAAGDGDPSGLSVTVRPERQRQGIGSLLWERLRDGMAAGGVASVEAWVREENAAGRAWLEGQGFTPTKLDGPVQILLPGVDLGPLEVALSEAAAQGITVTTLAEEKERDPDCLAKLHALHITVEADVPGNDPATAPSAEAYAQEWGQPGKLLFLAKDGERYVGLSTADPRGADPFFEERGDIFQQHLTGVRREYRRRGVATALKGRIIAYARQESYRTLWTNSDNPAMRALNWKLGFRSGPWLVYHKTLAQETAYA